VSVIIPAYNAASTLPRAIDSVLSQRRADIEIIVVDDGSTDETYTRIEPYRSRIRYCKQGNCGTAVARNRGIQESTGEYLAFLDADDEWLPGKLERQMAVLLNIPAIGLSSTGAVVVDPSTNVVDIISERYHGDIFTDMLKFNPIVCSSVVLRRAMWIDSGIRFAGLPSSMEDYAVWLKFSARYGCDVSPSLLVRYHRTPTNKTSSRTVHRHRMDLSAVFEEVKGDPVCARRLIVERVRPDTSVRLSVAREYTARGQSNAARRALMAAVASDWRALTYRIFWNTLLWSGSVRRALKKLRIIVRTRVLAN
jgi:glycosyltransferase involved in cell wall biosynthesis